MRATSEREEEGGDNVHTNSSAISKCCSNRNRYLIVLLVAIVLSFDVCNGAVWG